MKKQLLLLTALILVIGITSSSFNAEYDAPQQNASYQNPQELTSNSTGMGALPGCKGAAFIGNYLKGKIEFDIKGYKNGVKTTEHIVVHGPNGVWSTGWDYGSNSRLTIYSHKDDKTLEFDPYTGYAAFIWHF